MHTKRTDSYGAKLTVREFQMLHAIIAGKGNAQIGRALYLSEDTVKTHIRRMFRKLGVDNRTSAAVVALTNGLVDFPDHPVLPASIFPPQRHPARPQPLTAHRPSIARPPAHLPPVHTPPAGSQA